MRLVCPTSHLLMRQLLLIMTKILLCLCLALCCRKTGSLVSHNKPDIIMRSERLCAVDIVALLLLAVPALLPKGCPLGAQFNVVTPTRGDLSHILLELPNSKKTRLRKCDLADALICKTRKKRKLFSHNAAVVIDHLFLGSAESSLKGAARAQSASAVQSVVVLVLIGPVTFYCW